MTLKSWLEKNYGIKLVFINNLENSGYYLHEEKIMFVSAELPAEIIPTVVLHELGPHLKDEDVVEINLISPGQKSSI